MFQILKNGSNYCILMGIVFLNVEKKFLITLALRAWKYVYFGEKFLIMLTMDGLISLILV